MALTGLRYMLTEIMTVSLQRITVVRRMNLYIMKKVVLEQLQMPMVIY